MHFISGHKFNPKNTSEISAPCRTIMVIKQHCFSRVQLQHTVKNIMLFQLLWELYIHSKHTLILNLCETSDLSHHYYPHQALFISFLLMWFPSDTYNHRAELHHCVLPHFSFPGCSPQASHWISWHKEIFTCKTKSSLNNID